MATYVIIEKESVQSTNSEVKTAILKGNLNNWTVLSTHSQTQGRGQAGNTWETEDGKNIICSIFINSLPVLAHEQFIISKAVAVGLVRYLAERGVNAKIKWPNDIYVGDDKICGVLIENSLMASSIKSSIIGIGLNVNQITFSKGIPNPTSLVNISGTAYSVSGELCHMLDNIYEVMKLLTANKASVISEEYHKYLYRVNEVHQYKIGGDKIEGIILKVYDRGALVLRHLPSGEEKEYYFKEIAYCI